jgi:hypothetical protein
MARLGSQGEATLMFQRVVEHEKNKGSGDGIMQSPRDLTVCGKTRFIHHTPVKYGGGNEGHHNLRLLKKAVQQGRSE